MTVVQLRLSIPYDMVTGPRTGLVTWAKKLGTGENEPSNRMINHIVDDITRVPGDVCDRMLFKKFIKYNFGRDKKFGKGSRDGTPGWMWLERAVDAAAAEVIKSTPFPQV